MLPQRGIEAFLYHRIRSRSLAQSHNLQTVGVPKAQLLRACSTMHIHGKKRSRQDPKLIFLRSGPDAKWRPETAVPVKSAISFDFFLWISANLLSGCFPPGSCWAEHGELSRNRLPTVGGKNCGGALMGQGFLIRVSDIRSIHPTFVLHLEAPTSGLSCVRL